MMRQHGVAVLQGEDMGIQVCQEGLNAAAWYVWPLGDGVDGPYFTLEDALDTVYDRTSPEWKQLHDTVTATYGAAS